MSIHTQLGNITEIYIENIIKNFDNVYDVERDTHNGKYDITFRTKKDGLMRGLQIKTLGRRYKSKIGYSYATNHVDKYEPDTFIVCVNVDDQKAIIFQDD